MHRFQTGVARKMRAIVAKNDHRRGRAPPASNRQNIYDSH
jgi:hypothetical protein